ncbi:MAG TPA: NAD(P)-dependent oxidoreductase [Micromonosporaceae bacterium]
MTTVAVLGTGIMGAAMARNMLGKGLAVRVWNRTRDKAEPLAADGAALAGTPAEAVDGVDVVVTMLGGADSVLDTMTRALPGLRPGQVWAQMSTVGVAGSDRLAEFAAEHDLTYVDAPVQGTRQPAEAGKLTVLASGPETAREVVQPVFDAVGTTPKWFGPAGTGSRVKMVTNSWVLAMTNGVAEALGLAEGLGLDPQVFLDVVGGGVVDSPYLQTKAKAILSRDFTPNFATKNAAKDASLVVEAAREAGVRMDVAEAVAARFRRAVEAGHGDEDMAATYYANR